MLSRPSTYRTWSQITQDSIAYVKRREQTDQHNILCTQAMSLCGASTCLRISMASVAVVHLGALTFFKDTTFLQ